MSYTHKLGSLCYNSRCCAANIEPATPPKGFIKLALITGFTILH